jgi:CIC family chloride channel protein
LIRWITELLSGYVDYAGRGHVANPHVPGIGRWFVVLTPVIAGLVYGPLVYRFAREARGHGVPEVMLAVARSGGRIRPRVAVVKALASALCIGGGGSVGREGPIVAFAYSSPAEPRAASQPPSTPRSPACSSRWS